MVILSWPACQPRLDGPGQCLLGLLDFANRPTEQPTRSLRASPQGLLDRFTMGLVEPIQYRLQGGDMLISVGIVEGRFHFEKDDAALVVAEPFFPRIAQQPPGGSQIGPGFLV